MSHNNQMITGRISLHENEKFLFSTETLFSVTCRKTVMLLSFLKCREQITITYNWHMMCDCYPVSSFLSTFFSPPATCNLSSPGLSLLLRHSFFHPPVSRSVSPFVRVPNMSCMPSVGPSPRYEPLLEGRLSGQILIPSLPVGSCVEAAETDRREGRLVQKIWLSYCGNGIRNCSREIPTAGNIRGKDQQEDTKTAEFKFSLNDPIVYTTYWMVTAVFSRL